jgi:hypothetical protein
MMRRSIGAVVSQSLRLVAALHGGTGKERGVDEEWAVPGYTPMRELGVGAGGRVVLAIHESSGVPVAIKYLAEELFADKDFLVRFRVEARLLAGLRDPHLVRFYEYVESNQAAAIIMELVDGINLRELLRAEGPTGPEAALFVLKGSLLGLAAAHNAGVVHRDFKPGNVLVDGNGVSKLADFGIALPAGHPATQSGTPAYMAPEQWSGQPVTPAADVYSATAVFYECITGRPPYERRTAELMADDHETAPIPVNEIPEPLWVMFAHGLAKDPLDRPPTAAMFLEEVEEAARAAYGPRWETQGQRRLVEMATLLALLFPLAEPPGRLATALGLTRLGKERSRTLAAASVGLIVIAAGAGTAALQTTQKLTHPSVVAAPMGTPRPVPGGLNIKPSPGEGWRMPGGLPSDFSNPNGPGALPTTPVANPAPAPGTKPAPGTTTPGGGTTTPGGGTTTPADPVTDPPTDPVTDPPTDPVTDPPTDPVTDPPTDPVTDPPTDPVTDSPTDTADPTGTVLGGLSDLLG